MNHTLKPTRIPVVISTSVLALIASWTQAAVLLPISTFDLAPNTPDQQIQFHFTSDGTAGAAGLEFNIQIADGGTGVGGSISGPSITSIDLVTGTIFDSLSPNVTIDANFPQMQVHSLDLDSSTASIPPGQLLLATATIDTTGFSTIGQTWDLKLGGTLNGDTRFFDAGASELGFDSISNGSLRIANSPVPEPEDYAMMAGAGLVAFAAINRRKRGTKVDPKVGL